MNHEAAIHWLKSAELDLQSIEKLLNEAHLTPVISFHAQQTIEKSLKSILEYHEQDVPKLHSIENLFTKVAKFINLSTDIDIIKQLDSLYIDARYPGDFGLLPNGIPDLEDAKSFYNFTKLIYLEIKKHIKS